MMKLKYICMLMDLLWTRMNGTLMHLNPTPFVLEQILPEGIRTDL